MIILESQRQGLERPSPAVLQLPFELTDFMTSFIRAEQRESVFNRFKVPQIRWPYRRGAHYCARIIVSRRMTPWQLLTTPHTNQQLAKKAGIV
jgi:hypothetical protein